MVLSPLWPFQSPSDHETISAIIRRRSTNDTDVRDTALDGLDLSSAKKILDLGCGFGFMSEAVARRAAPDAHVTGVDVWRANGLPFRDRVTATGRCASFVCSHVGSTLPWPEHSFDLVVCSYSLYFFVEVLPEVARVLAPHGRLLALTHTEGSIVSLLRVAGLPEEGSSLLALARRFSAGNGLDQLSRWFRQVERIDYHNALRFDTGHLEDLLTYLRFKLPLLVPDAQPGDDLPEALARFARDSLADGGQVLVVKDDAVFHCGSPLCR
jgi:ubiquinone/menaquinone biosynthesis C-methylase UbiE